MLGLDSKEVIRALSPFGGGLGSTGQVCGALPGGLAVLGLLMGKDEPSKKDHKLMWKLSYKLVKGFDEITKKYGGNSCKDIARIDWKDIKAVKDYYKNPESRRKECLYVIGETAKFLGELIEEYGLKEMRR